MVSKTITIMMQLLQECIHDQKEKYWRQNLSLSNTSTDAERVLHDISPHSVSLCSYQLFSSLQLILWEERGMFGVKAFFRS